MDELNHLAAEDLRRIADAIKNDEVRYTYECEFNRQTLVEQIGLEVEWEGMADE